jgi:hypothetical protein
MTTPTMPFSEAESRRGGVEDEKGEQSLTNSKAKRQQQRLPGQIK